VQKTTISAFADLRVYLTSWPLACQGFCGSGFWFSVCCGCGMPWHQSARFRIS